MSQQQQDFSSIVFLSDLRLSFPHLITPQQKDDLKTKGKKDNWNAEFIMPSNHPGLVAFMARVGVIATEKWKEHAQTVLTMIQQDRKQRCYGMGSEKINKKTFKPYDGYLDNCYISAGRDVPPQMVNALGQKVDPADTMQYQALARKMYGGCRVNVALRPWPQENDHGRGIRADLITIQFLRDDVPFGEGNIDASGMFGAVAEAAPVNTAPAAAMPGAMFPGAGVPGMQQSVAAAPVAAGMPNFAAPAALPSFMK